jgi:hypothetical protein
MLGGTAGADMAKTRARTLSLLIGVALMLVPLTATADRDGDGIPDEDDPFPDNVTRAVGLLEGKRVVVGTRVGKLREDGTFTLNFFERGRFAFCDVACRFGRYERVADRKFRLRLDRADRKALVNDLEAFVEQDLFDEKGLVHDVDIDVREVREMEAVISKSGRRLRFSLILQHDAKVLIPKKKRRVDGKLKIKASGPFSGF